MAKVCLIHIDRGLYILPNQSMAPFSLSLYVPQDSFTLKVEQKKEETEQGIRINMPLTATSTTI